MIELKNINKNYNDKNIYNSLSVKFGKGLNMIYGPTGSGKTTLLNMIHMIDNNYSGNIFFDGKDIKKMNEKNKAMFRNQKIGYVFQDFKLFDNLNAKDNILIPSYISGNEGNLSEIAKMVTIDHLLNKKVNKLSGGEKQKIAIARALINDPIILLADEPTASLDSESEKSIMSIIKNISIDRIVIMVTHNKSLREYADNVYFFKNHELVKDND